MNAAFEKYLNTVDKCLKPLPTSRESILSKKLKALF